MAILIISLLTVGHYMEGLEQSEFKWWLYSNHKAFGVIALLAIITRVIIKKRSIVPAPAEQLKRGEVIASKAVHHTLYLMMLLMPLSGFLMSDMYAKTNGISMFGLFEINILNEKIDWLMDICSVIHEYGGKLFIALLVLHIGGVLKHQFIDKPRIPILKRML